MRRLGILLAVFALVLAVSTPALGATGASNARLDAILETDGDCQVTLSVTVHLDEPAQLRWPVPKNARSITVNGSGASTRRDGDALSVDLSGITGDARGDFSIVLRYTVPATVSYTEGGYPQMDLPLLSGFRYPLSSLEFSLTLPEDVKYEPKFFSGYHQQDIETILTVEASGNQITGFSNAAFKDRETLSMQLRLTKDTFPKSAVEPWSAEFTDWACFVCMGLAGLYWLVFLRSAPHLRKKTALSPEGYTAGELRCVLTGQGADLTLTVLDWARMGYILLHLKPSGRVVLHKRMDMGNERSAYENKIFRSLFQKQPSVDGSGYHYARLCRKVAAGPGSAQALFRKGSGNPKALRLLGALAGLFAGASLGMVLAGDALLAVLLIILVALLGAVGSWFIQNWVAGLHLRHHGSLVLAMALSVAWIALGFFTETAGMAAGVVSFQLLLGLAGAYGGRRTPTGRQLTAQLLGYRAYLARIPKEDLERIRRTEPDFFFTAAPRALALGVDRELARQFGSKRLVPCTWLTTGMDGHMTALEWTQLMHRAVQSLDEHQKRLPFEQLMGR